MKYALIGWDGTERRERYVESIRFYSSLNAPVYFTDNINKAMLWDEPAIPASYVHSLSKLLSVSIKRISDQELFTAKLKG